MRRMRSKLRIGGLAAVVSATTLVLPVLALDAAQAAPAADLSITKTVTTTDPPVTFIPELGDVRNSGSATFGDTGLTVRTTGPLDKAAQYWSQSGPIPSSASISWTQNEGIYMPGMQIFFDTDGILGNGIGDWNILVNVPSDNGSNWWLTPSSSDDAKLLAPSCHGHAPPCDGLVNGRPWYGLLPDWVSALGSNAKVYAVGFSLGSGASGINSGVISEMTYGSNHYDFTRHYSSSVKAAPGATVRYKIAIANSGGDATGVVVTDPLPADLTYVAGSLADNGSGWCSFTGNNLTCSGGNFPAGSSTTVYFNAKVSDTVSSAGLPSTSGHIVDVQKQEVFADLPAGQTKTYSVLCPSGYVPTDGGLLVDAVDQGGYYSDLVVSKSKPTVQSGVKGWTVTASNLGEERGQGKVKVTCLDESIGSSNGHTHLIDVTDSTGPGAISAGSNDTDGEPVAATCPAGYTPIAPEHSVTSGIAVVRSSYADGNVWRWMVDHEAGTAATFDVDCLAPETKASNGHTATLPLTTQQDTISVGPESRDEGIEQCGSSANAIVGGYQGMDAGLLSLGKEQRGNNYMFRFYNDDWVQAWNALIQVACVGVRTADEPQYYHITNTATVSSPSDPTTSSSSADISIVGDSVLPAGGVAVSPSGSRTGTPPSVTMVNLSISFSSVFSFTVKVIKGGTVVAKATKSYGASPNPRSVSVPTTSAGRNLGAGQVNVKVKTSTATATTVVTLS